MPGLAAFAGLVMPASAVVAYPGYGIGALDFLKNGNLAGGVVVALLLRGRACRGHHVLERGVELGLHFGVFGLELLFRFPPGLGFRGRRLRRGSGGRGSLGGGLLAGVHRREHLLEPLDVRGKLPDSWPFFRRLISAQVGKPSVGGVLHELLEFGHLDGQLGRLEVDGILHGPLHFLPGRRGQRFVALAAVGSCVQGAAAGADDAMPAHSAFGAAVFSGGHLGPAESAVGCERTAAVRAELLRSLYGHAAKRTSLSVARLFRRFFRCPYLILLSLSEKFFGHSCNRGL